MTQFRIYITILNLFIVYIVSIKQLSEIYLANGVNEAFLRRTPTEILADNYSSDVDLLIGYTSAVGIFKVLSNCQINRFNIKQEMMMYSEEIHHPDLLVPFDRQFEIDLPLEDLSVSNYTSKVSSDEDYQQ